MAGERAAIINQPVAGRRPVFLFHGETKRRCGPTSNLTPEFGLEAGEVSERGNEED